MAILTVGPGGFASIQLAVNASADGDTIVVAAGTYIEQVVVTGRNGLAIVAETGAQVTIQAPADLVETARSSSDREIHAVFTVIGSTAVTLQDIDVDGHGAGTTVDEGGGAGIANFYGIFYRNSSGGLTDVDVFGVRDPYPGGLTPGGQPIVDGVQRGIAVVADNDTLRAFAIHGGTISDFQKQAGLFSRADLDIDGVTVLGGGAQPVMAQNGFSINRSTGSVTGSTFSGIGYAGPAAAYSGGILASSNFDLEIIGNAFIGSNVDSAAAKVVGFWVFQNGPANTGGEISGNVITHADVGIAVDDSITPAPLLIENNSVSNGDLTDPYAAGVRFEPLPLSLTTAFDIDGSGVADRITGNAGDDILSGLGGADQLRGQGGDDLLDGGEGADQLFGGTGDDIYVVDDGTELPVELAGEGSDEIRTALASYTLPAHIERLTGTASVAQDLRANSLDNVVTAAASSGTGDFLRLQDGGADTGIGNGGDDVFYFGAAMTFADIVQGLGGTDQIALQGDYSGANALAFGAGVVGIENLGILPGNDTRFGDPGTGFYDYDITLLDVNVAGGVQMIVDANRLRLGEDFTFNGSAESDGSFFIYGGGGTDVLTGGAGNDVFLFGGQGQWGAGDRLVGGSGIDQLALRGDYLIAFGAAQLAGVEQIGLVSAYDTRYGNLGDSYDYDLTMSDGNVDGIRMTVDAALLRSDETLTFNGAAEDDGSFRVFGGDGADVIRGSQNADIIVGRLGNDTMQGNGGDDVFRFNSAEESTSSLRDSIQDFTLGDVIDLSRIDANALVEGNQAFSFIGSNPFGPPGPGSAGQLRFQNMSSGGPLWLVQGDTDGDGQSNFELILQIDVPDPITSGDFIL
ncbi:MAG TPA: calcium-binding protein [Allosphingosinicella sp.]|jgi:Ca2+-binding RTX toxin-like protein